MVLRRLAQAQAARNPVRGIVVATDVNSDGRTGGISLPSLAAQQSLLERLSIRRPASTLGRLAFVEAHGTGTPVGDPIEAAALGRGLGVHRAKSSPLLIGSVKTNIGHLEPGAGIAGLIKALLALNHRMLPPSLHFGQPSPHIPFDDLNLTVCRQTTPLPETVRLAGVNSFGFGGTNAHAVVAAGRHAERHGASKVRPGLFMLSAETAPALAALARSYAPRVAALSERDAAMLASAVAHRRERMTHRLVVSAARAATSPARSTPLLRRTGAGAGQRPGRRRAAAGGAGVFRQWRAVARHGRHRRLSRQRGVPRPFQQGRCLLQRAVRLVAARHAVERRSDRQAAADQRGAAADVCDSKRRRRGVARTRRASGRGAGHSVGEIAAAEAAGILDLAAATRLVFIRSKQQERVRGHGRMLALRAAPDAVEDMLQETPGVEIAAFNGPRGVTLAGPAEPGSRR